MIKVVGINEMSKVRPDFASKSGLIEDIIDDDDDDDDDELIL